MFLNFFLQGLRTMSLDFNGTLKFLGQCKSCRVIQCSLYVLIKNDDSIFILTLRWKSLKRQLLSMRSHSDSKGFEIKRPNDSIYSFPCPDCMCRANKTDGLRSSSATWSTHRIQWVFLTYITLHCEQALLLTAFIQNCDYFILPLSFSWEGIHSIFRA